MGFWKNVKNIIDKPAQIAGKTFYDVSKKITGSEKFSSAGARMFSASTSALGGDPLPFRKTLTAEDVGANPTLFRTGRQAGDVLGISIGSLFVGGALIGGGSAAVEGSGASIAGGAETSIGSFAAYDASLAAGAAEGVGAVAGGSSFVPVAATGGGFLSSIFGSGTTSSLLGAGLLSSLWGSLKTVGQGALTSLIDREGKDIFQGGSDSTTTIPGSGSSPGSFLGSSYLPYMLIALTLIGAFILTRKKRRK